MKALQLRFKKLRLHSLDQRPSQFGPYGVWFRVGQQLNLNLSIIITQCYRESFFSGQPMSPGRGIGTGRVGRRWSSLIYDIIQYLNRIATPKQSTTTPSIGDQTLSNAPHTQGRCRRSPIVRTLIMGRGILLVRAGILPGTIGPRRRRCGSPARRNQCPTRSRSILGWIALRNCSPSPTCRTTTGRIHVSWRTRRTRSATMEGWDGEHSLGGGGKFPGQELISNGIVTGTTMAHISLVLYNSPRLGCGCSRCIGRCHGGGLWPPGSVCRLGTRTSIGGC